MRTTDLDAASTRLRLLEQARARVDRAQTVAASGLKNVKGSDDPAWLELNSRTRSDGLMNDRSRKSLAAASTRLEATESALSSVSDLFARLQEIAVQGGTDTYAANDRRVLANEVRSLKSQALAAANAQSNGQFIFGGFRTNSPPFDASGNFLGDNNVMQVDAGSGKTAAAGIDSTSVFTPAGGVAIFSVFDAVATALDTNDGPAIRASLDSVQKSIEQVVDGRGAVGDAMNLVQRFSDWLDDSDLRLSAARAASVDADPLSAYTDLAQASNALDAALKTAAQATKLSLIDYL
ncbi:MAG: hypothetical protein IT381_32465 [Deltaproteobacteria bacterium]|nr:hypothetical protein [Deltaproteobacteria bacterium]